MLRRFGGGAGLGTLPAGGVVRPVGLDQFTRTSAGDGVLGNPSRSLLPQDSGGGLILGPQSQSVGRLGLGLVQTEAAGGAGKQHNVVGGTRRAIVVRGCESSGSSRRRQKWQ